MPLIRPPNDYGIPEPQLAEDKPLLTAEQIFWRNRRVQLFINVKPWKCAECGCTNHGRNKKCAYCYVRFNKITPRPADFKVEQKDDFY